MHVEFPDEDAQELAYVPGLPLSRSVGFDPEAWDAVEWGRHIGFKACQQRSPEIEGAWFVDIGEGCHILGMKGAQPPHHDRHMHDVDPDASGHLWNAVIDQDGDQMLLACNADGAWRHHPLTVGTLVYINVYQPHMISRSDPQDTCVIVQVKGIGPDEPERAIEAMGRALTRRAVMRERLMDAA